VGSAVTVSYMPYPAPEDPRYCPGSHVRPGSYDPKAHWQICDHCARPIAAKRSGTLFAHVNVPTRRDDQVQWTLIRAGLNRARSMRTGY
jgi:hypothetical protein